MAQTAPVPIKASEPWANMPNEAPNNVPHKIARRQAIFRLFMTIYLNVENNLAV